MKTAVIVFPASNCDRDAAAALERLTGRAPEMVWHGLLPGALMRNQSLKYVCKPQKLEIVNASSRFTSAYKGTRDVVFPIAHHDGNYFADDDTLNRLEKSGRVIVKYNGNPNGSARDIAGICNEAGNVMGMMPHPERAVDPLHGGTDGISLFKSILESI